VRPGWAPQRAQPGEHPLVGFRAKALANSEANTCTGGYEMADDEAVEKDTTDHDVVGQSHQIADDDLVVTESEGTSEENAGGEENAIF